MNLLGNKMKTITKMLGIGMGVLIVVALIFGGFSGNVINDQETIEIGVVGTVSGFGAYFGDQVNKGLEIAVEEINSNGGIDGKKVKLIVEDSETSQIGAVLAANKLINVDEVEFIIGDSWTSNTVSLMPVVNENKVLTITPTNMVTDGSEDDFLFSATPTVKDMMEVLADHAYNEMGLRKVGILAVQNPFGEDHTVYFRKAFTDLGGEITGEERFEFGANEVRTELIKLNERNPEAILFIHAAQPSAVFMKQAKELGIEVQWLGHIGIQNDLIVKSYPEIFEGMVYPFPHDEYLASDKASAFRKKFNERHGGVPSFMGTNAYDALYLLKEAIESEGEDPVKVKKFLLENEFSGASGDFVFDENGDAKKNILIKTIRNGEFVIYEDEELLS
jgi:branched-chain amino acid transport system substrate-binding protein